MTAAAVAPRDPLAEVPALADSLRAAAPSAAALLDTDGATRSVRRWAVDTLGSGVHVGGVRAHSVLVSAEGLTLRYSARVGRSDGSAHDLTLLVTASWDGAARDVHALPDDPALPALPLLLDPASSSRLLAHSLPRVGRERGIGSVRVHLVRHPRRGACVLRYDLVPGAAGFAELPYARVFAKAYPDPGAAERCAAVLTGLRAAVPGRGSGTLVLPRVLAALPDVRVCLLEAVPGRALLDVLGGRVQGTTSSDSGERSLRMTGEALSALHRCGPRVDLPVHDARRELTRVEAELAVVARIWPEVAAVVGDAVRPATRHLTSLDGVGPVTAHGDLTPSQVLVQDEAAGLVDLDGACSADPAFDVGRFSAYLDLAGSRARAPLPALDPLLDGYADAGGQSGPAFLRRVRAYRFVSLAGAALSATRRLKDHRLHTALRLLAEPTRGGLP